jgi:negative regulator of flagellin synthesis FlgM
MKIGPFDTSSARNATKGERTTARPAAGSSATSSTSASSASAQVALSSTATSLISGGDATFDAAKVERIAQAIREGSFRINAGAIADKLLDNAQELLARSPH